MSKDYIPAGDAPFTLWLQNFVTVLTTIAASIGVDPAVVAQIAGVQATWGSKLSASLTSANCTYQP